MQHTLAIYSIDRRAEWLHSHNTLERLRKAGHSYFKSQSILYDAVKGDRYAIAWALDAIGEPHA